MCDADQGRLHPLTTTLKACNFFNGEGQFLRLQWGRQYLSDDRIIFMLFKMSFSDAISISEDERIYTSEYLSEYSTVLGIRVGVLHLTEFDVGWVQRWRGFYIGGLR